MSTNVLDKTFSRFGAINERTNFYLEYGPNGLKIHWIDSQSGNIISLTRALTLDEIRNFSIIRHQLITEVLNYCGAHTHTIEIARQSNRLLNQESFLHVRKER